jgi:hypothetical protein
MVGCQASIAGHMTWSYSVGKETQEKRTRTLQQQTSDARVLWNRARGGLPSCPAPVRPGRGGARFGRVRDDQLALPRPAGQDGRGAAGGKGGKIDLFGLDTFVNMAVAAGLRVEMRIAEAVWARVVGAPGQ